MQEFTTELTAFCSEIVEAVNIDASQDDAISKLSQIVASGTTAAVGEGMVFKKSVVLIGTPGNFVTLFQRKEFAAMKVAYHSVVLDKIDLLQAMDFKDEIIEVAEVVTEAQVNGKMIFTTNVRDEKDLSIDEQEDFKTIKSALMGAEKALIVRMNNDEDDGRERTSFEGIAHLFAFTKTVLDKYILTFNLLKLAILEGKTAIMTCDITQAYRMKYFLAKFSLRSFVLSTDMPKS